MNMNKLRCLALFVASLATLTTACLPDVAPAPSPSPRPSASRTPTVPAGSSSIVWQNESFALKTGLFTAHFDVIPNATGIDGVTVLSAVAAQAFTDGAAIVRFNTSGDIDVRYGGAYAADAVVPYFAGASYHIRMKVNVPSHVYDVYVTPPGANEIHLASSYAFRTEQASVTQLSNMGIYADVGSYQLLNFSVVTDAPAPSSSPSPTPLPSPTSTGTAYQLPFDRSVIWQGNVGVKGDIPVRTIVCKNLSPLGTGLDDTSSIQTAITTCPAGQVVQLSAGTFNITTLDMRSNVTLRGAGMGQTILLGKVISGNYVVSLGSHAWSNDLGTSYNLVSGFTKGSTIIATSVATGWQAGDVILIDQLNSGPTGNPPVANAGVEGPDTYDTRNSGTRGLNQVVKIVSVSGNTATLEMPLYWSFDPTLSPQGTKLTINVQNAGVENLTLDSRASFNPSSASSTCGTYTTSAGVPKTIYNLSGWEPVAFLGSANNWLKGVEITGVPGAGVEMSSAYRNTVRSCKIHAAYQYAECGAVGAELDAASSANLFEDSAFYDLGQGAVNYQNGSGNVFAYNFITNMHMDSSPNGANSGIWTHGVHPFMNLYEGNYLQGTYFSFDNIHGTSSHNTLFRNRAFAQDASTANYGYMLHELEIAVENTYYNIVGNVLGTLSFENTYQSNCEPWSSSLRDVFVLDNNASQCPHPQTDGLAVSTLLRHQNWDSVHNAVVLNDNQNSALNDIETILPQSMYLTAKPTWFGNLTWPAIGPDLGTMTNDIPARARYLGKPFPY